MADKRSEVHKRSKSSLALSMLHRDRSRIEDRNEDASSQLASSAESPPRSPTTPSGNHLRPYRSRQQPADSAESLRRVATMDHEPPQTPTLKLPESNLSIEQSVRQFRLFEVLRSGDKNAIAKAYEGSTGKTLSATSSSSSGVDTANKGLEGTTILHLAVQCADPPTVEYVLSLATSDTIRNDLNTQDRNGNTPLHLASSLGRASVVRALLKHDDIDDSLLNFQGRSPLDMARNPEIFQQLQLSRSVFLESQIRNVHDLVGRRDYKELERLIQESRVESMLDINGAELALDAATIESGGTLLHEAARKRDLQLIQLLLLHGADPFRRDRKGRLPQDVTKDERTRAILKRSPAAAAAQRGVQEKAILGNPQTDNPLAGKEGREIKGYLKKWTNYTTGYKLRWFVLEDGVLSYYKNQDDAGSACRGAINMRIAKLMMDAQDKTRFEIQGKSSVKYHLKANHVVEAKRWFWALNNAIQWAKDEDKSAEQQRRTGLPEKTFATLGDDTGGERSSKKYSGKGLIPATAVGLAVGLDSKNASTLSVQASTLGDGTEIDYVIYEPSVGANDASGAVNKANTVASAGDLDDDEEYGDDASEEEIKPTPKDAFNITANSASLQLDLLANVSGALQQEAIKSPSTTLSDPSVSQAISTYESSVRSLKAMVGDLLKIARDRDAYWQYRLDRETDMRRLWEDSMAKIAREQEELEGRIGESEEKRRMTKRALREALDGSMTSELPSNEATTGDQAEGEATTIDESQDSLAGDRTKSLGSITSGRRRGTMAALKQISDSDSEADEEFFDAVDAGEVKVWDTLPLSPPGAPTPPPFIDVEKTQGKVVAVKYQSSYIGYEDAPRKRLKLDADERPKISLWGILKSMIGKDMTKMTLPVSFNEPTSLLQRVAEDMEYVDLLDSAAERMDSTERILYVAAFAASEYASTIGRVAKPFNPLLGETYEYARPDKGYRFLVEQVSHHPPIGAAWAESAKWEYWGESAVKSKFYGKSFDINPLGTWFLRLRTPSGEEELYTWKKLTVTVVGIITGSPTVDNWGPMEVKNWNTGESCLLDFKPRGWKASSAYQVSGKVTTSDGKTRWSIRGRWNNKIYARLTPGFDEEVDAPIGGQAARSPDASSNQAFLLWEANQRPTNIPFNLTPFGVTLNALPEKLQPYLPPTDTRLRPDQRAMEDGLYDFAASEKNRVEEKQRAKRRMMEEHGLEFEPRWFRKEKCPVTGEGFWNTNGEYWKTRESVAKGGKWERVEDIF